MIAYLHLLVILAIWSSPFYLSWKLILAGIFVYYLQLLIVGDCILTRRQFGSHTREQTFYSFCLEKLGFRFDREKIRFVADYILPWLILGISLLWQIKLGKDVVL